MIKINKIDILFLLTILVAIGNSKTAITAIDAHPQEELLPIKQKLDGLQEYFLMHFLGRITISLDGTMLAFTSSNNTIVLYKTDDREIFQPMQRLDIDDSYSSPAFGPENILASTSYNKILLWEQNNEGQYARTQTFTGHAYGIAALTFSPEGLLVSAAYSDSIKLWEKGSNGRYARILTITRNTKDISSIAFGPNGLLAYADSNKINIWEKNTDGIYTYKQTLTENYSGINKITFDSDGLLISVSQYEKTITLYKKDLSDTYTCAQTVINDRMESIFLLTLSPNGTLIIGYNFKNNSIIQLWEKNDNNNDILYTHVGDFPYNNAPNINQNIIINTACLPEKALILATYLNGVNIHTFSPSLCMKFKFVD